MEENQFISRYTMPDYMLHDGISKSELDRIVKRNLANSLAEALVNRDFNNMVISRKDQSPLLIHPKDMETIYELRCFVLSKEEYKEYMELKKLQDKLRSIVLW